MNPKRLYQVRIDLHALLSLLEYLFEESATETGIHAEVRD